MLKNYYSNGGVIVDSYKKEIALVSTIIHNTSELSKVAKVSLLKDAKSITYFEATLDPKESLFLDTKLFISNGDLIEVSGANFIMSGNEDDL